MDNSKSEKYIEQYLRKAVKDRGGWAIKLLPFNINGLPDKLCLLPGGKIFFAETKSTGKDASKLQSKIHIILRNLGFFVYVIDSTSQVDRILKGKPWTTLDFHFIVATVCKIMNVRQSAISIKNSGDRRIIRARQLIQYFARFRTEMTLKKIGEATGGFTYTTVIHNCTNIQNLCEFDKGVKTLVNEIENELINTFKV
jgi:hypothetical protein